MAHRPRIAYAPVKDADKELIGWLKQAYDQARFPSADRAANTRVRSFMKRIVFSLLMFLQSAGPAVEASQATRAQTPAADAGGLSKAIEQLRQTHGSWAVTTEFLNDDGSIAKAVAGTYRFEWVVPDRVLSGQSEIPELRQKSGLLFYVNEKKLTIEMTSVGADGALWVMTGAADAEVRLTPTFQGADGKPSQLRFTRYNVKPDSFESRMDYTQDGGTTWKPGNRRVFKRAQGVAG